MQQKRLVTQSQYTCKYCHFVFVREQRYLDHQCKQMKKEAEFKTPTGQAAWDYYSKWLRHQKKMPPPAASFLTSKFFRTFINFTEFAKKVDLPQPDRFIWLMVQKKYLPTMWMNNDVYVMYLEFVDREFTPMEQAKQSINTLFSVANKHEIDVSEVFTVMKPTELIHYIQTRKISPWLLLHSRAYGQFYLNKIQGEQRIIIDQLIRHDFWLAKKEANPDSVTAIRKLTTGMGI